VLKVLEAIERQPDDLPPLISTRYRMATGVLRLAVVAFGDNKLTIPAIVIARVFAEGGAGFGILLTDAPSRMGPLEPGDRRPLTFMRSRGSGAAQASSSADGAITTRERDVLCMISEGHSNKHIARTLKISPETVKSHVKRIFSKLSVSTRTEAVTRALSRGVL
jgi:DNA-binding CsgD family transcriptional regulator